MKTQLTGLIFLLTVFNLHAADTSGCSMRKTLKATTTAFGNSIQVQSYKASSPACWNAQDSQVILSYQWQQATPETHTVIFWAKVNQSEASVQAFVKCTLNNTFSYGHDTSNVNSFLCRAEAQISKGYNENISLEVAPQIDGQWDTRGYAQNYFFQL